MATKTKKKSGGSAKSHYKKNPAGHHKSSSSHSKYKKHRSRSNPGGGGIAPTITNALFVITGAVASKLGAQMVLGTNNTGLVGYAGNLAVGGVLSLIASKVPKIGGRGAAASIMAGTVVQIILRAINDYTPFGQYVAQLGMGDYQMQSFVTPQVLVDPWRNADVQIPAGWGAPPMAMLPPAASPAPQAAAPAGAGAAAAAAAGKGMSGGLYGGGWGGGLYG